MNRGNCYLVQAFTFRGQEGEGLPFACHFGARAQRMADKPAPVIGASADHRRADSFETEQIANSSFEPVRRRMMARDRRKLTRRTVEGCDGQFIAASVEQGHVDSSGVSQRLPASNDLRKLLGKHGPCLRIDNLRGHGWWPFDGAVPASASIKLGISAPVSMRSRTC